MSLLGIKRRAGVREREEETDQQMLDDKRKRMVNNKAFSMLLIRFFILLQNSPDLLDHRPYTSQPELVSDISSSGSLQQCSVPPPARISAGGLLVCVEPRTATVEVHSLAAILRDTGESQELEMFPGPLKPDVTHKNDVIKFCERKIAACRGRRDMADKESYILVWDMMVLLLRQKGQVEGRDLAELLLKDSRDGVVESQREMEGGTHISASSICHEEVEHVHTVMDRGVVNTVPSQDPVDKFRSYLLHGNKVEGLEFAMKAGLWDHALFLASKMDQRTYAGVMTRFADGLAINDPLQTLYQLMSARMPSAMKQCADQVRSLISINILHT